MRRDRVVVVGRRGRRDGGRAVEVPRLQVQISRPPPVVPDPSAGDGGEGGAGEGQGAQGAPHGRRHGHCKMPDEIMRRWGNGGRDRFGETTRVEDLVCILDNPWLRWYGIWKSGAFLCMEVRLVHATLPNAF